jgi:hypothetical protein
MVTNPTVKRDTFELKFNLFYLLSIGGVKHKVFTKFVYAQELAAANNIDKQAITNYL